jgi:hypothetical protein
MKDFDHGEEPCSKRQNYEWIEDDLQPCRLRINGEEWLIVAQLDPNNLVIRRII